MLVLKPLALNTRRTTCAQVLLALALIIAVWQLGQAAYIYTKAELAQGLIASAWQETLRNKVPAKPWRWADTWPVARLRMHTKRVREDLYVLAGATGSSLAFGPGHMAGTALPGATGNSVIGGHRDTHFAFLAKVKIGDELQLQSKTGLWQRYRVSAIAIRNINKGPLMLEPSASQVQLITCYPFDALQAGGPLRYVVTAVKV